MSVLNRKCGLIWLASASIFAASSSFSCSCEPVLDARVVPDLDRRRDAEHRREQDDAPASSPHGVGLEMRTAAGARSSARRAPAAAARGRPARAAARPASRSARARTICQARRCRLVKTNGEKCQIASFGQSSRRPPPAKPQPTAKGRAMNSPSTSGGTPTSAPTMRAGVRAGDQAGEERAFERQVGRVVVEQQPRRPRRPASGTPRARTKTRRSGQSRRSKIRMWRNRR